MTRVALITGGAGGIAIATAQRLCAAGVSVALVDLDPERLEAGARTVNDADGDVTTHTADLTSPDAVEGAVSSAVAAHGRLDILVNAVGIAAVEPIEAHDLDVWDRVMAVNLTSAFLATRAAVPHLKDSPSARIVNITSRAAHKGRAGTVAYSATKGALLAMTRVLAVELGPAGITVNAVAPGTTVTPMVEAMWDEQGQAQEAIDSGVVVEPRRLTQPTEIAAAVAYLCEPDADHVTGATMHVNGGTFIA